jgi:glucose dehydrogenase
MKKNEKTSEQELRQSLNLVITAVTFGITLFAVINGPILTAYTRAMGAGDFVYAVVMAMPVVGAVLQVFASFFMENTGKRKKMFLYFGFIHRLLWIPIAFVPFFIPKEYGTLRIVVVTLLIALAACASSIVSIAFNFWIGSLVPM